MEEQKPTQEVALSSPEATHPSDPDDHAALVSERSQDLDDIVIRERQVFYDDARAALIIDAYTEGQSLTEIARTPGMPAYQTLLKWIKTKDAFRHRMKAAHEARGFHFFDKALNAGTSAEDKDDVPRARLEFEAYKWAAEISDPATFGKSVKVSGDQNAPIRIVVSTGLSPRDIDDVKLDEQGLMIKTASAVLALPETADAVLLPEDHHEQMGEGDLA